MKQASNHELFISGIKWDSMFDSEQELVELTRNIDISDFEKRGYKGYETVGKFQRVLQYGNTLTKGQLTQLKRVSKEIYKYYNNL